MLAHGDNFADGIIILLYLFYASQKPKIVQMVLMSINSFEIWEPISPSCIQKHTFYLIELNINVIYDSLAFDGCVFLVADSKVVAFS